MRRLETRRISITSEICRSKNRNKVKLCQKKDGKATTAAADYQNTFMKDFQRANALNKDCTFLPPSQNEFIFKRKYKWMSIE